MLKLDEELQKELPWASGALVAFLIFLVYGGTSEPMEIAIAVGAFAVSWSVISYSVKNLGPGGTSKEDLQKEFQWFAGILVIFLAILTLIGTTDDGVTLQGFGIELYITPRPPARENYRNWFLQNQLR